MNNLFKIFTTILTLLLFIASVIFSAYALGAADWKLFFSCIISCLVFGYYLNEDYLDYIEKRGDLK